MGPQVREGGREGGCWHGPQPPIEGPAQGPAGGAVGLHGPDSLAREEPQPGQPPFLTPHHSQPNQARGTWPSCLAFQRQGYP